MGLISRTFIGQIEAYLLTVPRSYREKVRARLVTCCCVWVYNVNELCVCVCVYLYRESDGGFDEIEAVLNSVC